MQNVFNLLREKLEAQKEKYKKDRKNTYCRKTEMDDCDSCIADKKLQNRIDAIEDVKEIVNIVEELHKQELDDSVYRGKLFAVEEMLDKHATEYEMKFLAKIFAKLELSGKLKEEQFSTLLHEVIRLAILADEHIIK